MALVGGSCNYRTGARYFTIATCKDDWTGRVTCELGVNSLSARNCQVRLASAAGKDRGFLYTKRSGPYDEIELCGLSCEEFKNSTKVKIEQNCPPPP